MKKYLIKPIKIIDKRRDQINNYNEYEAVISKTSDGRIMNPVTYNIEREDLFKIFNDFSKVVSRQLTTKQQFDFNKIKVEKVEVFLDTSDSESQNIDTVSDLKNIFEEILDHMNVEISDLYPIEFLEKVNDDNDRFAYVTIDKEKVALSNILMCRSVREEEREESFIEFIYEFDNTLMYWDDEIVDWMDERNLECSYHTDGDLLDHYQYIDFYLDGKYGECPECGSCRRSALSAADRSAR